MKIIELQTLFDGNQAVCIEKHDGYCYSVVEHLCIKDLEKSQYKDYEVNMLVCMNYELLIRI